MKAELMKDSLMAASDANTSPGHASSADVHAEEVAGAGFLAEAYRALGRGADSPAPLDARILATARLQAESNVRALQRQALRRKFWKYSLSALLAGTMGLAALLILPVSPRPVPDLQVPALQPAGLANPVTPAKPLPPIQMPAQAPASTQTDDPCRLRVDVETATAEALTEERERLTAQGCEASTARLSAHSAHSAQSVRLGQ